MSALLPLALGLASISLSTSYVLSAAKNNNNHNNNRDNRLSEHPIPSDIDPLPAGSVYTSTTAHGGHTNTYRDTTTQASIPDFNWDSFRFLLPLPTEIPFAKSSSRMPSDSELAQEALTEESLLRFPTFKMEDAVTLGMNLRKRFRASSKSMQ